MTNTFSLRCSMEKYRSSQHQAVSKKQNGRRNGECNCSVGHFSDHLYSGHPDYFYKKIPTSQWKADKELGRSRVEKRWEDSHLSRKKSKDVIYVLKDRKERKFKSVQRAESKVGKDGKKEATERRIRQGSESEEGRRVSLGRVARIASCHHLPRVPVKPRSLSAASSSSRSSLLSAASRRTRTPQRASSVALLLPSPSIRSFSPSSHMQYSSSYRPTSHLNHKLARSTSSLLQGLPKSPFCLKSPLLSISTSSVQQFSSSFSSLEESNLAEERNREVDVYLQVPRTFLVSRRNVVDAG